MSVVQSTLEHTVLWLVRT